MWYVVQVRTGTEENILIQCRKFIPDTVLERCFIPYYEEKKHIRGTWTILKKVLFPGYVFMVAENSDILHDQLKKVIGLTKIIGTGETVVPLTQKEIAFLQRFGGDDQVVAMSEGVIEQSKVRILSGPLCGMEGLIKKIDRHKRKAWLELPMFGRMQQVEVGLEIVMKTV